MKYTDKQYKTSPNYNDRWLYHKGDKVAVMDENKTVYTGFVVSDTGSLNGLGSDIMVSIPMVECARVEWFPRERTRPYGEQW